MRLTCRGYLNRFVKNIWR